MPPFETPTYEPFNHPMHIANTIAKRQRELIAELTAIELGPKRGRKRAKLEAHARFYAAMSEIEARIKAGEGK